MNRGARNTRNKGKVTVATHRSGWSAPVTILKDLGLAYRKAKLDLYYPYHALRDAIAGDEANLAFKDTHHETYS